MFHYTLCTNNNFYVSIGADVINFDGNTVLSYQFKDRKMATEKDVISLKFKSILSNGVLFHGEGQQGDYITLELVKSKLVLKLNLGNYTLYVFKGEKDKSASC